MTIKQATWKMIQCIRAHYIRNSEKRITDKEIAKELEITPVTFSRLYTGVQNPDIITWWKLCKKFKEVSSKEEFNNLINEVL